MVQVRVVPSVDEHSSAIVTLEGRLLDRSCRGGFSWAEQYERAAGPGSVTIDGLFPGTWLHSIRVTEPATGQVQYHRSLLLAGPYPNRLAWRLFAETFTVTDPSDAPPPSGSLRSALARAPQAAKPYLIRFDDAAFPPGVRVLVPLQAPLPPLEASDVTIDAIDALGLPGFRGIDAGGQPFPALNVRGSRNHLVGLALRNAGGNDRDVLSIRGPEAWGNVIERCHIDTAASADGIGIDDRAGDDFVRSANVIRDCVITAAHDKGIKVTTGATALVERSRVAGNSNGGIQATLGGRVLVRDSLIESNGGLSAQNGLSANGANLSEPELPAWLVAEGNVVQGNGGSGVSARAHSLVVLRHNAFVGNSRDGLRAQAVDGRAPILRVEGSLFACNASNGAVVEDSALPDFGGGSAGSVGQNLFARNPTPRTRRNLVWLGPLALWARGNFWEGCAGQLNCTLSAVRSFDLGGRTEAIELGQEVSFSLLPPRVQAVRPRIARAAEPLRVFGQHFVGPETDLALFCQPISAPPQCPPAGPLPCVTIGGVSVPLDVVTPTLLIARMPYPCVEPVPLVVHTPRGSSKPVWICTDA